MGIKMILYKFIIVFITSFFIYNISYANDEYDKCVKEKTKEAGERMDDVYQAIIIQMCKKETEDQNNSNQ